MEKEGVKERKYMAAFTATGALVYQHELAGRDLEEYNDTGRNVGFQLVPYTIKYAQDGSYYLAINAMSFRNMITLQGGENHIEADNHHGPAGFFKVVDNIDFLMFKWDKGMSFDNLNSYSLEYLNADIKIDLLNSDKSARFLALTAGGKLAGTRSELTLDSGEVISIKGQDGNKDIQTNYRYGIEYNDQFGETRMNVRVGMTHTNTRGHFLDQQKVLDVQAQNDIRKAQNEADMNSYNLGLANYEEGKQTYEKNNLNNTQISDESYTALTGIKKPEKPEEYKALIAPKDKIIRNQVYLSPSIEFSKQLSENGSRPIRAGVQLNANIPLRDNFKGGKVNIDMKKHNRNLLNATIFLNF